MISNNIFYNTLNDINLLFVQNNYFPNMAILQNRLYNEITMTYTNKHNYSKVFKIKIQNRDKIEVQIPLNTINYYFCTKFNCIIETLNFLQLHVLLNNNHNLYNK